MNNKKASAYGAPAAGTDFRKTWDKAEYEAKAKQRDEEERERMKEADEALQKGKKPRRKQVDLPKPTELMKQREAPLELNKNQNKTMIVQGSTRGPGAPGFYCDVCSRTSKDSSSYLDHLNSRFHLRALGQKTQVARSTIDQEIQAAEEAEREAKRLKKLQAREAQAKAKPPPGVYQSARSTETTGENDADEMSKMMGFSGGFKSRK
ncbi:hypothetical protein PSHT_12838 [Puccinia striiformis]|uniref:U1-type domain-containing protein n=1 Tax=Puccinia striiformis TaxID=27350 RepID=A0A2S4UUQ7_9BASI|nr:hypothetical protein PSHT_12838 [Puccinia striiformis]